MLVQAPRDAPAVLVADLDLDQRRDWLELFPFLTTRRPDAYGGEGRRGVGGAGLGGVRAKAERGGVWGGNEEGGTCTQTHAAGSLAAPKRS